MSTSETSTISLDKQIAALSALAGLKDKLDWVEEFVRLWDISIPISVGVQIGWIESLSDKGVEEVERCFIALAKTLDKTPEELVEVLDAGVAE